MPSEIEPLFNSLCRWALPHRNRHGRDGWCSCICHRPKGHDGAHRCEREMANAE